MYFPGRFPDCFSHRLAVPALAGLALLGPMARPASAQTFNLTYYGAQFGNNASAVGTITLDPSQLHNPGPNGQMNNPFVTAFSLTVSGASSGNGTFGLSSSLQDNAVNELHLTAEMRQP